MLLSNVTLTVRTARHGSRTPARQDRPLRANARSGGDLRLPLGVCDVASTGASRATGLPRHVITTSSPLATACRSFEKRRRVGEVFSLGLDRVVAASRESQADRGQKSPST